jgi:hypothetical protein
MKSVTKIQRHCHTHFSTRWARAKSITYKQLTQSQLHGSVLELKHQCAPSFHAPHNMEALRMVIHCRPSKSIEIATRQMGILISGLHLLLYKTMALHRPAHCYREQRVHFATSATHKEVVVHNTRISDEVYFHLDVISIRILFNSGLEKVQVRFKTKTIRMEKFVYGLHCHTIA